MRKSGFGIIGLGLFALAGCGIPERDFLADKETALRQISSQMVHSEARAFTVYDPTGKAIVHRDLGEKEYSRFLGDPVSEGEYTLTLELKNGSSESYWMIVREGKTEYHLIRPREDDF